MLPAFGEMTSPMNGSDSRFNIDHSVKSGHGVRNSFGDQIDPDSASVTRLINDLKNHETKLNNKSIPALGHGVQITEPRIKDQNQNMNSVNTLTNSKSIDDYPANADLEI
jgi:hypothetical protein